MKNLDMSTLRSFHTVAKFGSVSRASEELFLTQSAISQHVKRLEGLINLKLFARDGRSIVLTKQGEEFLEETRDLLKMNDSLFDKYCYSGQTKVVSIGLSEHLSQRYLPRLLGAYSELSNVKLDVKIGLNGPIYADLQEERIDIGVLINERNSLVDQPALTVPQKLCWVGDKARRWEVGQAVPVVVYSGPCLFRTMLLSTLKAHKVDWQTVYNASSIADLTAAVRANLGISILLESEVDEQMVMADDKVLPNLPDVDAVVYMNGRERYEVNEVVSLLGDSIFVE